MQSRHGINVLPTGDIQQQADAKMTVAKKSSDWIKHTATQ